MNSKRNSQTEAEIDEDVVFDSHSAWEPRGYGAEILADADRCFDL